MTKKESFFSGKIDKLAGIPFFLALVGLWQGRRGFQPKHISRAAFIRMGSARDTVLTEAAAGALKKRYPKSELVYFVGSDNYEAASLIMSVDKVVKIYPESMRKSIGVVKTAGFFDLWVDFGLWSRFEAMMTFFANAGYKIGFRTEGECRHFAYDAISDLDPKRHLYDNISSLMRLSGIEVSSSLSFVAVATQEKDLVIFNMFPDKPEQSACRWNDENWKYLLSRLSKKGYRVALIGSKVYSDEADKFTESLGSDCDIDYLVGRVEGLELLKTLSRASLVVSVDSWVLQVAAAMSVHVLGLYGASSPEMYAPIGKYSAFIKSSAVCCGCQNIRDDEECRLKMPICMDLIDCGTVEQKVFNILKGCL